MQDLVSDFVSRVNNSLTAGHSSVKVLKNNITINICKKLVKLDYFDSFDINDDYTITIQLKPSKITKLKRISTPGKRVHVSYKDLPRIEGGIGWNILSTSQGIKSNFESKRDKIGGELLFQIY